MSENYINIERKEIDFDKQLCHNKFEETWENTFKGFSELYNELDDLEHSGEIRILMNTVNKVIIHDTVNKRIVILVIETKDSKVKTQVDEYIETK